MRKKILFILLPVLLAGLTAFFLMSEKSPFKKEETIRIALVAPLSGPSRAAGNAMVQGTRLCADKINRTGGIDGKQIELLIYDDRNDKRTAMKIATELTVSGDALMVIGHYYSSTSDAAGEVYKKNGMPALTASASADHITLSNDWYFRIVPSNRFAAEFIANYILKILNRTSASIISDKDIYGSSLSENFEKAAGKSGIEIKRKWEIDTESKTADEQINKIISELRSTPEPGVIFFATHGPEAVKIITSLKYPGTAYTVMGPDSFSGRSFIEDFMKYPREMAMPGYYSDGIYALSFFLPELTDEKGYLFRKEFIKQYDGEPSWISVCYYDAMQVAAEALARAEVQGKNIREDRRTVRESLSGLSGPEVAVRCITGDIYFDKNGDNRNSFCAVGVYKKQHFLPSFSQYQFLPEQDKRIGQKNSDAVRIDETAMIRTDMVYTGIHINEISNFDISAGTYTIDFYIWFRFQKDFSPSQIRFDNAVNPIALESPLLEMTFDDSRLMTYRVKARFRSDFDFHAYPFEHQNLRIEFHHGEQERDRLIFVPDILGLSQLSGKNIETSEFSEFNDVTGWTIRNISFYQDIMDKAVPKKTARFSRFNALVTIKRQGVTFVFKVFFPIIAVIIVLYLVYFIPAEKLGVRLLTALAVMLATGGYHLKLHSDISADYVIAVEYSFFTVYALAAVSALTALLTFKFHKHGGSENRIRYLTRAGKILYPFAVSAAGFLLLYIFRN